MKRIKVLLLGGGLQALTAVRSLYNNGYEVVGLFSAKDLSRYIKKIHKIYKTDLKCNSGEYLSLVETIIESDKINVIIPLSDGTASTLSFNKQYLEKQYGVKCAIPDYNIFELADDKWNLMSLCREYGFPHPRTEILSTENLNEAAGYVGFPALIKPNISVGARGITLVNNIEELNKYYKSISNKYGACTLQEYIETGGKPYYNVMIYRREDGKIINTVVIEIIRYYPLGGGSSSLCKVVKNGELVTICTKVLDKIGWIGFADFDILQTVDGEFKIIEINTRVPASLRAAEISGVNFPDIIAKDVLNIPVTTYKAETGKYLRYLGLDVMWFVFSKRRFKAHPSWFNFFSKSVYYQEYGGFYGSLMCGIHKIYSKVFER